MQSMHNLSRESSRQLFQPSSNTGIIQDFVEKQNLYLQGHMNIITCSAVSRDKSFIITADMGENSMIIQWDAHTGDPIRTFQSKSPQGQIAVDISSDNKFIALISQEPHHALWIYSLEGTQDLPIITGEIDHEKLVGQFYVRFNEDNSQELVTNNAKQCIFWNWHMESELAVVNMYAKDIGKSDAESITMTCFIPFNAEIDDYEDQREFEKKERKLVNRAISGTTKGRIIIWDEDQFSDLENEENKRSILKIIDLTDKNEENQAVVKRNPGGKSKSNSLNVVTVVDKYIVVGINDGRICFQDSKLRIEGQFDLKGKGDISSISFADQQNPHQPESLEETTDKEVWNPKKFWCPDFVVATKSGLVLKFDHLQFTNFVKDEGDALILTGLEKEVIYMSVHPVKPEIAIVCRNSRGSSKETKEPGGKIEVWDYNDCKILFVKSQLEEPTAIEQSPDGNTLLVAWSTGTLHILQDNTMQPKDTEKKDSLLEKLTDKNNPPRTVFEDKKENLRIRKIKFCPDSKFFAVCNDTSLVVQGRNKGDVSYEKLYKIISHPDPKKNYSSVDNKNESKNDKKDDKVQVKSKDKDGDEQLFLTDFCFAEVQTEKEDEKYSLFSIGNDRWLIQQKLYSSSFKDLGSIIHDPIRIEWDFEPKSITYQPQLKEHLLAISTSDFKIKLFNSQKNCFQHTQQGPDFGEIRESCIKTLWREESNEDQDNQFQIFSTKNSIIGMIKKPVDGNPSKNIGIVAHPTFLRSFCVKAKEGLIFTSGGEDLSIKVWEINKSAISRQLELAEGLLNISEEEKLIQMVGDNDLQQDMKDQFQQTQLRDASNKNNNKNANNLDREKTKKTRILTDSIPVEEMPNIFRALGQYPSELEIESMKNEVRSINDKQAIEGTRKHDQVTFSILVRIFVNQRPQSNLDNDELINSLKMLGKKVGKGEGGDDSSEQAIDMLSLVTQLTDYGETFEKDHLQKVIEELAGPDQAKDNISISIPVNKFAKNILGLQTINDIEGIKEFEVLKNVREQV